MMLNLFKSVANVLEISTLTLEEMWGKMRFEADEICKDVFDLIDIQWKMIDIALEGCTMYVGVCRACQRPDSMSQLPAFARREEMRLTRTSTGGREGRGSTHHAGQLNAWIS